MSISEKCARFDLDEFFLAASDEDFSAIMIITPRQNICFSTYVHPAGASEIMEEVYGEDFYFDSNDYWPDIVNDYGCVAIQLLKRGFVIVNLPKVINQFQYDELFKLHQEMIRINGEIRKLGEEPVELHSNVFSRGRSLSLGRALMVYKRSRVREFEPLDEKIIKKNVKK